MLRVNSLSGDDLTTVRPHSQLHVQEIKTARLTSAGFQGAEFHDSCRV